MTNELGLTVEEKQILEETMKNMVAEDKSYDAKFFVRFNKQERSWMSMDYKNYVLVKWEYEDIELPNGKHEKGDPVDIEYSADARDYFLAGKDHVFELSTLYCTASYEGISKRVVIKEKPAVTDLEVENRILLTKQIAEKDYN